MTVLNYTTNEFFALLKKEGAEEIGAYSDENVVLYKFQDEIVPVQIRTNYYPCYVVKICEALKISCPEEFSKVAKQIEQANAMKKKGE